MTVAVANKPPAIPTTKRPGSLRERRQRAIALIGLLTGAATGALGAVLWNLASPRVAVCPVDAVCRQTASGTYCVDSCPSPDYPWMLLVAGLAAGAVFGGMFAALVTRRGRVTSG